MNTYLQQEMINQLSWTHKRAVEVKNLKSSDPDYKYKNALLRDLATFEKLLKQQF